MLQRPPAEHEPGLGPLDAIAILLGAACLALFLLWLATSLNGTPLSADVPAPLRAVVASFWGWLTGGGISLLIWMLRRRVSGTKYLIWTTGLALVFVAAVLGGSRFLPSPERP